MYKKGLGFSLIEAIVVIAIIAILALVTIVGVFSFGKVSDLNRSASEFISILKLAQSKTLASEGSGGQAKNYGVYINTGVLPVKIILFRGQSYATREQGADQIFSLPVTIELYDVNFNSASEVVFSRLTGVPEQSGSVSFRVVSDYSKNKTVYVSSSGAVGFVAPVADNSLDQSRVKDTRHVSFYYGRAVDTVNELITLTFDGSQTRTIAINMYLVGGELQWKDTVSVSGSDQIVEIRTIGLGTADAVFNIFRDRRYNNKSLVVTISGDSTGNLANYTANGSSVSYSSVYISNFVSNN